jgi:tRNA pseudouridine38-40 synthase
MRWFFRCEYDGRPFAGWQAQRAADTVQARLEKAIGTVVRRKCRVVGAGRTDAGVHAAAQGVHTDLPREIDLAACGKSINAVLGPAIAVRDITPVDQSFHARYSAKKRKYAYYIATRKRPLKEGRVWVVTHRVNWKLISQNLGHCVGRHDFAAFCAAGSGTRTTVCTVTGARLRRCAGLYVIELAADRFLYKMVRSITGTLIDIGRGVIACSIGEIIRSKNRSLAGETAPPHGLVLEDVIYDEV